MRIPFVKMQGIGNDFVILDELERSVLPPGGMTSALAQKLCDRRFGIGADQIMWLKPAREKGPDGNPNDAYMEVVNADGSTVEMCGNGIRAVALYLRSIGRDERSRPELRVETMAGLKLLRTRGDQVSVDMGPPKLLGGFAEKTGEALKVKGAGEPAAEVRFFEVNVGNPHAIIFVDDADKYPVERQGAAIEMDARFPKRTNVEFVQVTGPHAIRVRVWERGAGITLACGTGACASAVAAIATGRAQSPVEVSLPGGKLTIRWDGKPSDTIFMEGPAVEVFRGEFLA